ncbi:3-keto-5-aminohexanoate cleavage protein [Defluviimonas sp. WL0002]|uniref:3-keto-5-aminohexanoate cleavage protein n=1 Tax=Albidovulum marisflavi TaxID=2984159 RepID=A0ABT2ZDA0_9RHOB|nr:3-keto-5-aminohexanoate cleavage protein [Defluviimonas sp. WL0002]MCV2869043.1 3-keto-5-aminohexanoate cleavage protein [Defluviimonas sp. WL0002]
MKKGFLLNVAFTGAVSDKARNPAVPYTTAEIVADSRAAVAAGASVGHFHVRDNAGRACNDPARYADLFAALRDCPDTAEMVIVASTSGRHGQTLEERAAVLSLPPEVRPDMASLTLSSLNFAGGPSINGPDTIRALARSMLKAGVRPELEVFDLGMVAFLHRLIDEGLVEPPYYVNVILGNVAGLQADPLSVGAVLANLPQDAIVSLGGIGSAQGKAHLLALAATDGLRTGVEDNFRLPGQNALASNPDMANFAATLARLAGRTLATPAEARRRLGLANGN